MECPFDPAGSSALDRLSDFDRGVIVGLLIGEGSFGGDGKQPQITLRMHVRHEALLRWLVKRLPDTRLYGPYDHNGRRYFQWMARGRPLVRDLLPLLEAAFEPRLDAHAAARLRTMCERYGAYIERTRAQLRRMGPSERAVAATLAARNDRDPGRAQ